MSPEERLNLERDRQETDWQLISEAITFYKGRQYRYQEVPWLISDEAVRVTWPGPISYATEAGNLVGSAEQSMLELELNGLVPEHKKIVTCSPCWRDEPEYDEWHQTSFMKVELYSNKDNMWRTFLNDALALLGGFYFGAENLKIVKCPEGPYLEQYDIMLCLPNDEEIELGSYGHREEKSLKWSYGTGLAEPRTSQALKKHRGVK